MRPTLVSTFVLTAALAGPAFAQQQQPAQEQSSNAGTGQEGATQALQDARQKLQAAA